MKRSLIIMLIAALLYMIMIPVDSSAEEMSDTADRYSIQLDDILADNDIAYSSDELSRISFKGFAEVISDSLGDTPFSSLKLLGKILLIIVITSVLKNAGGGMITKDCDIYGYICAISAVTLISEPLVAAFESVFEAVRRCGELVSVFIPVFCGITVACGCVTSAGLYDISVLAASEMIVWFSKSFIMPSVSISTMLSVTSCVSGEINFSGIVQLIKKVITWGMTVAMTLFTGFLTLKCTISGKADGAVTKTARFLISGSVPIVGGAVSDAYATVRSSFEIIRSTVGTAGCFAVAVIILPPLLNIIILRAVMWTVSAAAELFSEDSMSKLAKALDNGLAVAQSVLICYGLMFILSTGILLNISGG